MTALERVGDTRALHRIGDRLARQRRTVPTRAPDGAGFGHTDAGNGEYFARLYGDQVRFDHRRARWLVWADHWWREDHIRAVRRMAKEAARARYQGATAISDPREQADFPEALSCQSCGREWGAHLREAS